MLDPQALFTVEPDAKPTVHAAPGQGLVLVHALQGFVDAGSAAALVGQHILATLNHRLLATFAVDELLDYRSRRPAMIYDHNHYASYDTPELLVHWVEDLAGVPFLLLTGPEPDVQWERFVAALTLLIEDFGVVTTVALHGIGMAVPHTRPMGVLGHGNRPEIIPAGDQWPGTVQIPGSAAALLELRLGQVGRDALGFVVQVPHYLAETAYPQAAGVLLDRLIAQVGLSIPQEALQSAAERTAALIAEQIAESEEVSRVVLALEEQYDALRQDNGRGSSLTSQGQPLPSAEELGAEVERFLASGNPEGWTNLPPL